MTLPTVRPSARVGAHERAQSSRFAWSAELELLARLARLNPTPADRDRACALAADRIDWERLLRLAVHHGVGPLVHANATGLTDAKVPVEVLHALRQMRIETAHQNAGLYAAWLELCRTFDAAGIPAITLKGFHTAITAYGDVGLRAVGDLDFLVDPDDVARTLPALRERGYDMVAEWKLSVENVGLDHVLRGTHEITLVNQRGTNVDLHWRAGPPGTAPDTSDFFAACQRMAVGDQQVLVPSPAMAGGFLLMHGHKSAWNRLRWLVDVAEVLDHLDPDTYDEMRRRLDALGSLRALGNAQRLIASFWEPAAPVGRSRRDAEPAHSLSLAHTRWSLEREADSQHVYDGWRPIRRLWDRAGCAPSLREALLLGLRPNYFDWASVRLPRPIRFGYYGLRPIRITAQAIGAAARRTDPVNRRELGGVTELTFVTAIYSDGPESLVGGRGRGLDVYLPSLINIAQLGAPIVVFCPPADVPAISTALAAHYGRFRVWPARLQEFERSAEVLANKRDHWQKLPINDRNELLCFQKSYWLQRAIAMNPFGHEQFFWIDAGLTHHGNFPERRGGVELAVAAPASRYHPHDDANIFKPALGTAIARAAPRGRVLFCAHPVAHGQMEAHERVAAETFARDRDAVRIAEHLVGGLFGGHRSDLAAIHDLYVRLLGQLIASRTYTLEEQVFSALNALFPERFALERFDTWAFYAPGEPCARLDAEGDSYYKIFTRMLDTAQPERS